MSREAGAGSVTLVAPLGGLQYDGAIDLGSGLSIQPIREHVREVLLSVEGLAPERVLSGWYQHSLIHEVPDGSGLTEDGARESIDETILRLRLLKPGLVGYQLAIVDRQGWYARGAGATGLTLLVLWHYVAWGREGLPSRFAVEEGDIEDLRRLFRRGHGERLLAKRPYRLFFRAYHEPYATDRFLSNAIALECMLVNEEKEISNIRYKFVDRGCFLLNRVQQHEDGAEGYVPALRRIYDARCELVHASGDSRADWQSEEELRPLRDSEEFCRILLRYVVDHPEMMTASKLDEAKRACYNYGG